jgi:hypothetical protein
MEKQGAHDSHAKASENVRIMLFFGVRQSVAHLRRAGSGPYQIWHTPGTRAGQRTGATSAFIATNPEPPTLVSECDFFVQFWQTRKGPNQFADAMRDAE